MKSVLTMTCAAVLALALAVPAYAGEGKGRRGGKKKRKRHSVEQIFKHFDKDASGTLTSDEVPARVWTKISKADADGDGAVSKKELRKARRDRHKKRRGGKKEPPADD